MLTIILFCKTYYETDKEAFETVRKGKSWGALIFAKNYSEAFVERLERDRMMNDVDIDLSSIMVHLDMSSVLQLFSKIYFYEQKFFLQTI